MTRTRLLLAGIALGAVAATLMIGLSVGLREQLASWTNLGWVASGENVGRVNSAHEDDHHSHDADEDVLVKLSDSQIAAAGIEVTEVGEGVLVRRLSVPGAIVPSGDRIARVAVKLLGTVAELRKRLGESVEQGEVVAVIESREVADAKSEYLAARLNDELQQTLVERARKLTESRALAENEYLRTRAAYDNARVKLTVARQKLSALGLMDQQIAELPEVAVESLRRQDLRAPISGRIAERRVDLGALVGREGQESELFVIVNLDQVWVELAIPPADLPSVRDEHDITVIAGATGERAQAKITFISPLLDKDTRTARVVATLE
jgi:cobalt-zinc-cadmium efflux system membrane fusion protein